MLSSSSKPGSRSQAGECPRLQPDAATFEGFLERVRAHPMIEAIRSVLSFSWAYQSFWHGIGGDKRNRVLGRGYICPQPENRILDIGCGPGTKAPYLPSSDYVGCLASAEYINQAKRRFL